MSWERSSWVATVEAGVSLVAGFSGRAELLSRLLLLAESTPPRLGWRLVMKGRWSEKEKRRTEEKTKRRNEKRRKGRWIFFFFCHTYTENERPKIRTQPTYEHP